MRASTAAWVLWITMLIFWIPSSPSAAQDLGGTRVVCSTFYDDDYFYFAAHVTKPQLAGTDTGPFGDPLKDDAVAVFLQREDQEPLTHRTPHSVEMAVSAAGGAQLYRGADATPLKGFNDFLLGPGGTPIAFKYAVTRQGDINGPPSKGTGYTVELAIPWIEIGGPPKPGERMRFNVVAVSAAQSSPPLLSMSPLVKTAGDLQNPSLWGEIVFVEAPLKSAPEAPAAKVCSRVFTSKPVIDGEESPGEWNSLTSFGFEAAAGGGSIVYAPSLAAARTRPSIQLRPAPPPITPAPISVPELHPRRPQAVPRLVFALYDMHYQNDPRKNLPLAAVRDAQGASLLVTHPLEGDGPWMSYDNVAWHLWQMQQMAQAGVDVAVPIYHDAPAERRGLLALAAALGTLRNSGGTAPTIAPCLEIAPEASPNNGLTPQERLYQALDHFYTFIPPHLRCTVALSPENGGGSAAVALIRVPALLSALDASGVTEIRKRFLRKFGSDVILLAVNPARGQEPATDGAIALEEGRGCHVSDAGWIRTASVGVLPPNGQPNIPALAERQDGEVYRANWKSALAGHPAWIFLDAWNDYGTGTEIAPTLESGVECEDITLMFSRAFHAAPGLGGVVTGVDLPAVVLEGSKQSVRIRLANEGISPWPAGAAAIECRWVGPKGTSHSRQTIILSNAVAAGQWLEFPCTLNVPSEQGPYRLQLAVVPAEPKAKAAAAERDQPFEIAVQVEPADGGRLPAYAATLVRSDLPFTVETGGAYTATVTLRNEGSKAWKAGGRVTARLWRYPAAPASGAEAGEALDLADASVPLPSDTPPGGEVTVVLPVVFARADGSPFPVWDAASGWTYGLRWEVVSAGAGQTGCLTSPEPLALTEADVGAVFTADLTPQQMPGDKRIPVKLNVRNRGPQTWLKQLVRVGYHWYTLDGIEVVWEDETTPLPQDVPPGGETGDLLAWITAPPNDGTYWLVWDVKAGDTWQSTLPSGRANETRVHRVQVIDGKLIFVDLAKTATVDGVVWGYEKSTPGFDGLGAAFPAEITPPYVETDVVPSTIWLPVKGAGLNSSRSISFRWGPKGPNEHNFVSCTGQRVQVASTSAKAQVCKRLHILAAATKPDTLGAFTLIFTDDTQQYTSFPINSWTSRPHHDEETAFLAPWHRAPSGLVDATPVRLYHYIIPISEAKKLIAVVLPNAPGIKIAAITLEK
ncbi:MAG: sugar-binding protein [Chthonomonadales bacterium]